MCPVTITVHHVPCFLVLWCQSTTLNAVSTFHCNRFSTDVSKQSSCQCTLLTVINTSLYYCAIKLLHNYRLLSRYTYNNHIHCMYIIYRHRLTMMEEVHLINPLPPTLDEVSRRVLVLKTLEHIPLLFL